MSVWKRVAPASRTDPIPGNGGLTNHSAVVWGDSMVVFGGEDVAEMRDWTADRGDVRTAPPDVAQHITV